MTPAVDTTLIWTCAALSVAVLALVVANAFLWRDLRRMHDLCMAAWIRLGEAQRQEERKEKPRDTLIRRLARAEALIDGLRAIATEAAMLAQLDALRADSCWAPLHDETEGVTA